MIKISKSWISILSVIFLFDQMLLPMFHVGGAPIKISYLILLFVFAIKTDFDKKNLVFYNSIYRSMFLFMVIVIAGLFFFNSVSVDYQYSETIRMLLVFVMGLGSLKLGLLSSKLPSQYITYALIGVMALILLLVFTPQAVPFISNMWWKTSERFQEMLTQNKLRPTPFGDGSGVRVNILFLGITLLYIHKIHDIRYKWIIWISVLVINVIMGSRNQFIVFMAYSYFFWFQHKQVKGIVTRVFLGALGMVVLAPFVFQLTSKSEVFTHTMERIGGIFNLFGSGGGDDNDTIARPLLMFESFKDRFIESPIFGSSFEIATFSPFNYLHFHNDWLLIFAVSGILGFAVYAGVVLKIYRALGIVAIFPFFLPGLTNSFIWAFPSYLVYFFIIGYTSILKEKNKFVTNHKINS